MNKLKNIKVLLLLAAAAVSFTGCMSKGNVDVLDSGSRNDSDAIQAKAAASYATSFDFKDDAFVKESKMPLLSGRTTSVKRKLPEIFSNQYYFNPTSDRRLIDIIKSISGETGIVFTARDDVYNPTATKISSVDATGKIDATAAQIADNERKEGNLSIANRVQIPAGSRYSGTVEGFLDYISSVLNISWQYIHEEDRVLLTRYVEQSYRLFVPPSEVTSEGDKGNAEIWKDTKDAIEKLLSQGGEVSVNQNAGTISVVDTKDVQQMVAKHIEKVNRNLQKSVTFKLEILAVNLNDADAAGIDMSTIHTGSKSMVSLAGAGAAMPNGAGLVASITGGMLNGSQIIQQNLRTKGEVSTSLSRVIQSMNNQLSTVEQLRIVPVITEFTPPVVNNGVTTQGGVSMKDIEVGFKMKIVPSIMPDGQNMVLRLGLESSDIDEIVDVKIGNQGQMVQQAKQTKRTYQQTFSMRNAETLVVTGFYDRANEFSQKSMPYSWLNWLFSSRNDKASRTYYVVLLTASITNGSGQI